MCNYGQLACAALSGRDGPRRQGRFRSISHVCHRIAAVGDPSLALLQPSSPPSSSYSEEVAATLPSSPICRTRSSLPCRVSSTATPRSTWVSRPCSATSWTSSWAAETEPCRQAGSPAAGNAAYHVRRAPGAVPPAQFPASFAKGGCGPLERRLGPLRQRLRREYAPVPRVPNGGRPAAGTQ